jgi:3-oxoacyl-[acyl-carrier-protein] synthase-3
MFHSKIVGLGHHVPETVITNEYLSNKMDTNNEWIIERQESNSVDGWILPRIPSPICLRKQARIALERARLTEKDIDFIVFATITPDYFFPGSGVLLQRELGLDGSIAALDIRNACSGFIYALSVADQFIRTGMYKTILVIGAEIQSTAFGYHYQR